jgi:hypothetical protein
MTVISWECVSASRDLLGHDGVNCWPWVCSDAHSHEVAEVAETAGIAKQKGVRMAVRFPSCTSEFIYFRSDSDWTSQLVSTRAELATLQERYDDLRADRDRLAQTLEASMKKYKRFKQWIIINKGKIPPKPTERDGMPPFSCSSSTPGLQQQSVIKMLETPMTPTSLCPLSFFVSVQCTFR